MAAMAPQRVTHLLKHVRRKLNRHKASPRAAFREMNFDGSGALSVDEFGSAVMRMEIGVKPEEVESMVQAIGKDENGQIKLSTFNSWLTGSNARPVQDFTRRRSASPRTQPPKTRDASPRHEVRRDESRSGASKWQFGTPRKIPTRFGSSKHYDTTHLLVAPDSGNGTYAIGSEQRFQRASSTYGSGGQHQTIAQQDKAKKAGSLPSKALWWLGARVLGRSAVGRVVGRVVMRRSAEARRGRRRAGAGVAQQATQQT